MRGGKIEDLSDEWREFRLVRLTGWTLEQIDAAPAARLDWLLTMEDANNEAAERLQKKLAAEAEKKPGKGRRR